MAAKNEQEAIQTAMHFATSETGIKKQGYYEVPFTSLKLAKDFDNEEAKFNRRNDLGSKEELTELMNSLITEGPRMPLKGKKAGEFYEIYQGERRLTAAKMAYEQKGLDIIFKVIVYPLNATRKDIKVDTLLTNDGKPLNPLEKAEVVADLIKSEGMTEKEAAQVLGGVSLVYVKNLLRLNEVPDKVKKLITDGVISATELMQFLKTKNLDLDSLVEQIKEAAKAKKDGKVKAKDLRKKKGEGEEEREETETRAATSLGEFKRFRKQNSGIFKNEQTQVTFELVCLLVDNQMSYDQILKYFTGK